MKRIILSLAFAATMLSCAKEQEAEQALPVDGSERVCASAADFVCGNELTKTTITQEGTNAPNFAWKEGDIIGIVPMDNETFQSNYKISEILSDPREAMFDGGVWALKDGKEYAAYYPLKEEVARSGNSLTFSFLGQTQSANNSLEHLGAYDYMYASSVIPAAGLATFQFKHLISLVRLQLTVHVSDTYKSVSLESDNAWFASKASLKLSDGTATATEAVKSATINLSDIAISAGDVLTVWFAILPTSALSDQTLSVKLFGTENTCTGDVTGITTLAAGSAYSYSSSLSSEGPKGNIQIPDAKLKAYLVTNFDEDGDGEISTVESDYIITLNCSGKGIYDLTGLEYCTNLEYVNCSGNSITQIDFHTLTKLKTLVCYGNPLTNVNLNDCKNLSTLNIKDASTNAFILETGGSIVDIKGWGNSKELVFAMSNTGLHGIHFTSSTVATKLDLTDNDCAAIHANGNTALTDIRVPETTEYLGIYGNTSLKAIDLSHNTQIQKIEAQDSGLESIDVTLCPSLFHLNICKTGISELDVTRNLALQYLAASYCKLSSINVQNNVELTHLDLGVNNLSAVNVRYNTKLGYLSTAFNTAITTINVKNNPSITYLNVAENSITELDVTANTKLQNLIANSTQITELDLSKNIALTSLDVSGNTSLTTLDVSKNIAISTLNYDDCTINATGLKIGTYVIVSSKKGVVFSSSGKTVKIISIDETKDCWLVAPYYTTGATSWTDGATNTKKMPNAHAAKWCVAKGKAWYLPAINELKSVMDVRATLNNTLSKIGGTQVGTTYWTSTEYSESDAYLDSFYHKAKNTTLPVRAIRAL